MLLVGKQIQKYKLVVSRSFMLLLLLLVLTLQGFPQPNKRTANWINRNYGIDFNTGEPVEMEDPVSITDYSTSLSVMSDTNGNLLFYSTGPYVYNKFQQRMMGFNSGPNYHAAWNQPSLCMPKPGSDSLFYVFTSRIEEYPNPMFYYIVDMSLDNGLGDIIDIDTLYAGWDAADHITTSYLPNSQDYWLLTRKLIENKFAAFKVTSLGADPIPVLSDARDISDYPYGRLLPSYDKKYLIRASAKDLEINYFNNKTGEINFAYAFSFNEITSPPPFTSISDVEFSPCSKYLYVSYDYIDVNNDTSYIFQFDMAQIDAPNLFKQSAILVGKTRCHNLQLAPDGKIYSNYEPNPYYPQYLQNIFGIIEYPSKAGEECGYTDSAFTITEGSVGHKFFFYNFAPDFLHRFDFNGICESDTFTFDPWFFPEPDSIAWNFGDPTSGVDNTSTIPHATHKFSDGGSYEVSVYVKYPITAAYPFGRVEETSRKVDVVYAPDPNLGPDTTICSSSEILLDAACGPHGYSWSTGEWGVSQITVSDSGWYWVRASNSEGCFEIDSIHIAFHPAAIADTNNLIISPTTCGGSVGVIRGLAISGIQPFQYKWIDDLGDSITNTIDIYHLPVGNYTLQVIDENGCVTEFGSYLITDAGEVLIESVDFSHEHCGQQNGSIIVTATSGLGDMLKYSITNGEPYFYNEGIFTNLPSGNYAVRVKDSTNCEDVFTYNPIIIESIEGPQITDVQITPATVGQNNGSFNIIASGSGDTIFFSNDDSVNFQINDGFFTNLYAGSYTCVVVDEYGCDTTFVVELSEVVTVELHAVAGYDEACPGNSAFVPLKVSNFNDVASFKTTLLYNKELLTCTGFTNAHTQLADSIEVLLFPTEGKIEIYWTSSAITLPENSKIAELVFQSIDPGTSLVDWDGTAGASLFLNSTGLTIPVGYTTGNIEIYKELGFFFFGSSEVCIGDNLNITALVSSHNGDVTYLWTLPDGSTNSNQNLEIIEILPKQSGEYKITVTDTANCYANDSVVVTVFPIPVPAFAVQDTIFTDNPFDLDAGSGFIHYYWNTGDTTQFIWVDTEGWYSAQVKSVEGCVGLDSSFVLFSTPPELIKIFFPNAFTPNGDGLNDEFKPVTNYIDIQYFSLSIFNRWGALVYQTNDISQGWDGTFNGEHCQAGAYVYKIAYSNYVSSNTSSEIKMGTVMLVR